ncbi:MAG: metallophosphoesterase [Anaerolineales bacterium]|nr:metallophosphoesterase [Anaerolineales bacterium]
MKNSLTQHRLPYLILMILILTVSAFAPTSVHNVSASNNDNLFIDANNTIHQQQTENIVFAVIGDYGLASQNEEDVANLVKSWNPNFIVTVGDNNYEKGLAETIDQNIGQYYHDYIFRYTGKYGNGSSTNRFFPALGNHDWGNNGIKPYLDYFTLPGNERYYDFVGGSIHFFILDSDRNEPDETSATGKQARWLKNGLAASTSPFNIVILHHAPYSSGTHGSTSYMQWPFKDWGAQAVLSGHDHLYERLLINDIPYFVNGLGGDSLYSLGSPLAESRVLFNQDYGAMRVEANNTSVKFQFFTRANLLIDEYTISKIIPSGTSIVRAGSNPANAVSVDYMVRFSESVTGVDISDFLLTPIGISGASIMNVNGSGADYTVTVNTGTGDGTLDLDLIDNDSIVNNYQNKLGGTGIGNGNFMNGETYTIDKITPRITSIIRADTSPSGAASVNFIVNFSEPVLGLDISDFTLSTTNINNATINNINGINSSYVVTVNTGNGAGTIRLDPALNNSITDFAGNMLDASSMPNNEIYTIEESIPRVISIVRANSNPSNAASVDFIVKFSESVTGVDISDFSISAIDVNAVSLQAVSGSGDTYTVSVQTGFGDGDIRLDLIDNDSIINKIDCPLGDAGISNGNFTNGETYAIDKTAPIVTSVIRAGRTPSTFSSVDYIVTFSESVTGVEGTDFSLNAVNINDASVNSINTSDPFYIVNVNTGNGIGSIRLDLLDDDSIADPAGNKLGGAGAGNGNFTNGESYAIEKSIPSVTSITRASSSPSSASSVDFIVTFSESVTGVDASDFSLSTVNIINASIKSVNNFDPFYIVTVNSGAGTGTIRLDLLDNDSIVNSSINTLGGSGLGNGSFMNGDTIMISKTPVNFSPPTLREPQRNFLTNNSGLVFSWAKVRDAVAYEIVIAADDNFSQIINRQIVSGLSYTSNVLLTDGIYYWRVCAYNSNLQPGKFSLSNSFIVDTIPPAPPALLSPTNNTKANARLKFIWEKISTATRYQIEIDNNADFSSPEWSSLRQDTTYQIFTVRAGIYFWHVRAKDMANNWSSWSTPNTITIP